MFLIELYPTLSGCLEQKFYSSSLVLARQFGGKRVYLYTQNSNQLDPFASELTYNMFLFEKYVRVRFEKMTCIVVPPNAEVWAERRDDDIMLNIDPPPGTVNMTVFYCEPIESSLSRCKVSLNHAWSVLCIVSFKYIPRSVKFLEKKVALSFSLVS